MSSQVNPHRLRRLLDTLRKTPEDQQAVCLRAFAEFGQEDWLVLAGLATAASLAPVGGRLDLALPDKIKVVDSLGKEMLDARLTANEVSGQQETLDFPGYPVSVSVVDSPEPSKTRRSFDPVALVTAMRLIRDHLDSTSLKPRDLREKELAEFAAIAGLNVDTFRRLAMWQPQVHLS
jgi:hypothetical protein